MKNTASYIPQFCTRKILDIVKGSSLCQYFKLGVWPAVLENDAPLDSSRLLVS